MAGEGGQGGDDLAGRSLGGFIVRERIGEGGFGVVYRAEQPDLGREAVVKVLHTRHRQSDLAVQRFLREARLASRLDHPYAAHVYASGFEADGLLWIAMELVRGRLLAELLKGGRSLPLGELCDLLDKLCEVVQTAHEQGIIHRDIKPSNVMVIERAGRTLPKLLDFGLAKTLGGDLGDAELPELPAAPTPAASTVVIGRAAPASISVPIEPMADDDAQLTGAGMVLGSPPYMAPEQWSGSGRVDARADLYALGVVAFEAASGRLPFKADTLHGMREAHLFGAIPPLGGPLPRALDAVIARVLAKAPGDRYASALELAAGFRAAAGLGPPAALPALEEALARSVTAAAPQPIAEAVALLAAARNVHQARDTVWGIVSAAARTVCVLALASRSRGDHEDHEDPDEAQRLLGLARGGELHDEDRVGLARELCRPFAGKPEAHPLPRLVAFFFAPDAGDPFAGLLRARSSSDAASSDEAGVRALVARLMPETARLLRALAFLDETPIVVPRFDDGADLWMGVRRPARALHPLLADPPPGRPLVVDAAGKPRVELWPLAQAEGDELFLFDGRGRRGARLVAVPAGFEIEDEYEEIWDWFGRELGAAASGTAVAEQLPYRGLAAFTADDRAVFFGRERESLAAVNRLRAQPLVAIVGPSGAGKSSFVQAGVIPALPEGWKAITFRPGPSPMAALEAALARAGVPPGASVGERLRAAEHGRVWLLVVDQLEELFTLCRDPAERERAAAALADAARDPGDPVRVIVTLRDDFLIRADALGPLRGRLAVSLQLLSTPSRDTLLRILTAPLERIDYAFEDEALPAVMVDAVADQPGALALLSFTALAMWELRDRQARRLRRASYDAIGGVGGALAQHAEQTLHGMTPAEQRLTREVFRHLVSAEGTRAVLSRAELAQLLGDTAESVVEKMVAARLLVVSESEQGERIEVIHEALLSAWPRLAGWQREDAEGARLRDLVRAAARQWQERGRPAGLLWRDDALTELGSWRARHQARLTDAETAFADASAAAARRGRRIRIGALSGLFVFLVAVVGVLYQAREAERTAGRQANRRLAELYQEQGRQALLGQDPMRALLYLAEAYARGLRGAGLDLMLTKASQYTRHQVFSTPRGAPIYAVDLSPDGAWLATGGSDRTLKIWSVPGGRLQHTVALPALVLTVTYGADGARLLATGGDAVVVDPKTGAELLRVPRIEDAAFDPGGRRVVVVDEDGAAGVLDASTGAVLATLAGDQGPVSSFGWSPDGTRLVTGGEDGSARVWDAGTGAPLAVAPGNGVPIRLLSVAPDSRRFAVAADRVAHVYGMDGTLIATLRGHDTHISSVEMGPDGLLLTSSYDNSVKIWDPATGDFRASLRGHSGPVGQARWSHDGRSVISVSSDGTARLWSRDTGSALALLVGHESRVRAASFSADDALVATGGDDGTARVWRVYRDDLLLDLAGAARLWGARYAGGRILTVGDDRVLRSWDAASGAPAGELATEPARERAVYIFLAGTADGRLAAIPRDDGCDVYDLTARRRVAVLTGPAPLTHAVFSPDGTTIATAHGDGSTILWDVATGQRRRVLPGHTGHVLTADFAPDGRLLVTGGRDHTARIVEVETGRLVRVLAHDGDVGNAAFAPDGRLLVTTTGKMARVWNVADGTLAGTLTGHTAPIHTAAFSASGLLATGSGDGTVRLWDPRGAEISRFSSETGDAMSVIFSPEATRLLAVIGSAAKVWDVAAAPLGEDALARLVSCYVPFRLADASRLPSHACEPAGE